MITINKSPHGRFVVEVLDKHGKVMGGIDRGYSSRRSAQRGLISFLKAIGDTDTLLMEQINESLKKKKQHEHGNND